MTLPYNTLGFSLGEGFYSVRHMKFPFGFPFPLFFSVGLWYDAGTALRCKFTLREEFL